MKTHTREEVYRAMRADVVQLLDSRQAPAQRWAHTSRTDLIEMIYIVYLMGDLDKPDGSPASFRWMVDTIFQRLRLRVPANPVAVAQAARNRKGVRQRPFEERYLS